MTIVAMWCKVYAALVFAAGACTPTPATPASTSALARVEASRDLGGKLVGHSASPTLVVLFASWCPHCRAELREIAALRVAHPELRVIGVDYPAQEDYANRGSADALRAFAAGVPWLDVVTADDPLFEALGSPPHIPTTLVFDAAGTFHQQLGGEVSRTTLARALGY